MRSHAVLSLHSLGHSLQLLPTAFSIVLKGCSSVRQLFTTYFPQGNLGSVLFQVLHGSSRRQSQRDSPRLHHWAFWLHFVFCRRWCWPWTRISDSHWIHSSAVPQGRPSNSVREKWCVCFLIQGRGNFSLQKGLLSISQYIYSLLFKSTDVFL